MTIHSRIPNEWILASIADIAEVRGGKRLPKGKALLDEKTPFPYIRVSDFKDGSIDPNNLKYLDPKTQSVISQYTISSADLYISIAGSIGMVGEIPDYLDGANLTENAAKLCNLTGIHKEFLRHVLSGLSAIEQFQDKMTSSGQPKLALFRIKECIFPFPPAAEQKVIADKLDTLLAQVENTKDRLERIPQILKRFRQSVLTAAVSGRLTEEWRNQNGVSITVWDVLNVGDVAMVATGKTPSRKELSYWEDGDVPWLTSASTGAIYSDSAEQFVTRSAVDECSLKIFPPGTLLLAMYGEGKTRGQVTELRLSATCNQACAAVTADEEKILRSYLKLRLLENYEETRKAAAGGAQPNLNLHKVRAIGISVPPKEEQAVIVRRVDQLFAHADRIEQQVNNALARVNNLAQSILAKAFRGELTEQWRKDNPELISGENSAEALLERIKTERAAAKPAKKTHKQTTA